MDDIEEDDIEEDDFEEDTNFCSGKIPFNINCGKFALTIEEQNFAFNLASNINCGKFALTIEERYFAFNIN